MTSLARISALACAIALLPGCRIGHAAARAAGSFFDSPRKVAKVEHPVDPNARLAVIWVGHSTALVQIDDKVVLTDPVFTTFVGELSKRLVEPGIDPDALPPIDAVVVSHMHLDHLSLGSLAQLEPKIRTLLLPPGGTSYLTDFSFPAIELGPWEPWERDGLRITAVPVDHVGFRYGLDDQWMTRSFTGYVIEHHGLSVYFGGDTAYDQRDFVATSERFPDLDVALLPIGPIEPRWIMRRLHLDPREAVQAFVDLGARRMVPIHYDTFVNSTDHPGDALRELDAAKKSVALGAREIVPLKVGERRVFMRRGEEKRPLPGAEPAAAVTGVPLEAPAESPPPPSPPAGEGREQDQDQDREDGIPEDDRLD